MTGERERVRKTMRELERSLKCLPNDPPPEEVHKLRTATRHVEAIATALPETSAKESRRLLRSIEPIRKAAGSVRDMDVLTGNARRLARYSKGAALARLVEYLQCARRQRAAELRRALGRRRERARSRLKDYARRVLSEMAPAEPGSTKRGRNGHVRESVRSVATNCAKELSDWPVLSMENVHEFRLKVKELRYILQLFADAGSDFIEALADVQRRIGDWHDWHQLEEIAREIFEADEGNALVAQIAKITKRKFDEGLAAANTLRRQYLRTAMPNVPGC